MEDTEDTSVERVTIRIVNALRMECNTSVVEEQATYEALQLYTTIQFGDHVLEHMCTTLEPGSGKG